MTIPADVRDMLLGIGQRIFWTPASGAPGKKVPCLLLDRPAGGDAVMQDVRDGRVAQIRVCKEDVPELRYRDKFTEDDGTVWSVMERQRIIDDRIAGTWRATVVTEERQVF